MKLNGQIGERGGVKFDLPAAEDPGDDMEAEGEADALLKERRTALQDAQKNKAPRHQRTIDYYKDQVSCGAVLDQHDLTKQTAAVQFFAALHQEQIDIASPVQRAKIAGKNFGTAKKALEEKTKVHDKAKTDLNKQQGILEAAQKEVDRLTPVVATLAAEVEACTKEANAAKETSEAAKQVKPKVIEAVDVNSATFANDFDRALLVVKAAYEAFPTESKAARIGNDNGIVGQLFGVLSACNGDLTARRTKPDEVLNFTNEGVPTQSFVDGLTAECEINAEDFFDKFNKGIEDEPARKRFATAVGKDKALLMGAVKSVTSVKASWGKGKK